MIRFEDVSVTYDAASGPTVQGVDLTVPEGELVLLVGPSGVGKSTLLGTVSGLVPHFTGGTLRGRVTVAGRDTRTHKPRELADVVGTVGQDPLSHFVTDTVEDELAYGMESLGLAPDVMRRRVEETLDLLGLADLRDRPIATLSGGQQQRVAIGSVLTPHPQVLVLDEPTSALDPAAAEEVLAVLQRLVHDLGTTVLMAEHRLERVVQYADQVLLLAAPGEAPMLGDPAALMARSPVFPPVVALGRIAGWSPLPLTVRDARRRAGALRERLAGAEPRRGTPAEEPRRPGLRKDRTATAAQETGGASPEHLAGTEPRSNAPAEPGAGPRRSRSRKDRTPAAPQETAAASPEHHPGTEPRSNAPAEPSAGPRRSRSPKDRTPAAPQETAAASPEHHPGTEPRSNAPAEP
ncbi:ATP-binding cassette domain-containing protein, partial [Streptomyces venezuelae]|uniref:ABC transporter ATP-binding protein n=1 Tax=Streptomyces venezuelae TaxID=54571 RepID=UPI003457225C